MNTPEKIDVLRTYDIIVVGTNSAGRHAGGLAREAALKWGLLEGFSEGLIGRCYGFPTLDHQFERLTFGILEDERRRFYECAIANPDLTFLLTKVGCGIAGFKEEDIKQLFKDAPQNIIKPKGW